MRIHTHTGLISGARPLRHLARDQNVGVPLVHEGRVNGAPPAQPRGTRPQTPLPRRRHVHADPSARLTVLIVEGDLPARRVDAATVTAAGAGKVTPLVHRGILHQKVRDLGEPAGQNRAGELGALNGGGCKVVPRQ